MSSRLGLRLYRHNKTLSRILKKPKFYFVTLGGVLCLCTLNTSQCESPQKSGAAERSKDQSSGGGGAPSDKPDPVEEFITKYATEIEGIGFGGVMGICCGVAFRRVSSGIAYTIGLTFLGLQALQYAGYININYHKAVQDVTKVLDADGDGKLTSKDVVHVWKNLKKILTYNLPGMSGFSAGVALGLYFG